MVEISAVEQLPGFAIGANAPAAHEPRVAEIQPLLRLKGNLTVWLGDKRGVALVGCDVRWAYGDFEHRHRCPDFPAVAGNTRGAIEMFPREALGRSLKN